MQYHAGIMMNVLLYLTRAHDSPYLHAKGETLFRLFVWSANGDGNALTTSSASSTILTNVFVWVSVSSFQTNRARCTLYKKILDLFDKESVSGAAVL